MMFFCVDIVILVASRLQIPSAFPKPLFEQTPFPMKKLSLLFIACFLAMNMRHATEPLEIATNIDKTTLTTGDFLRYQVQIIVPRSTQLEPLNLKKFLQNMDVEALPPKVEPIPAARSWFSQMWPFESETSSQVQVLWEWNLWPTQPGQWKIPALNIQSLPNPADPKAPTYVGKTQAVSFQVRSFFQVDSQNLQSLPVLKVSNQPPPALGNSYGFWLAVAGAALALWALFIFFYEKKPWAKPPELQELPHEHALRRLEELERFLAAHPEKVPEYYFQLSEIFREYLENRFGFLATAMTSQEFLPLLQSQTSYSPAEQQSIVFLTERSDLIKYADAQPTDSERQASHQEVVALIEKTAPLSPEAENEKSPLPQEAS